MRGGSFATIIKSLVPQAQGKKPTTESGTSTQTQAPSSFFRLLIGNAGVNVPNMQRPSLARSAFQETKKSAPQDLKASPLSRGIKTAVGSAANRLKLGGGNASLATGYSGNVSL